ncbi:patatin-like phospholipase family protein [Yeosuana sp. AK3]
MKRYLSVLLLFICVYGFSQEIDKKEIKVGLVLSGGGAKGLAHIGVLKVIDSLGVKIDYVAGTSMGAIIGALYASGYSGNQLDSIFNNSDFDILINDKFPRSTASLNERKNSEKYAASFPFEHLKINLPSALSRGQNLYNLLYKLTLHVSNEKDFSKLPIPFFCVATNIETGQPVILDHGNLAKAITASGAFPSLFQPVEIDNKIFIDGGVTNNYPVEELKSKGVDVIIGVDVQDGLKDRTKLDAAQEILLQINNFRTIEAMKLKKKLTDIYVKPDIEAFSVLSFDSGKDIISNGLKATLINIEALKNLVDSSKSIIQKPKVRIIDSLTIDEKSFIGNNRYTRSYLLGKLKLKKPTKISYKKFTNNISNLMSTNNFDAFYYELIPTQKKDTFNLVANLTEDENTTYLKLGLHYDGLYKSAALINITKKRFITDNDEILLDIILGDNVRYDFDYFIDKGFYFSIGLKSWFNQFERNVNPRLLFDESIPIVDGLNRIDVNLQDQTNQIYLQTLLANDFAVKAGFEHKRLKIKSQTLSSETQNEQIIFENTNYFSLFSKLKLDTYDNPFYPTKGVYFDGDFHWYIGSSGINGNFENVSIAKADLGYAIKLTHKLSLNLESSGGFRIGDQSINYLHFAIGGYGKNFINNFSSFYGYDYVSLAGNSFVKGTITGNYNVFKNQYITTAANFANIEDNIFETGEWITSPTYSGYAIGYAIETFLGPIEAKYTWSPETKNNFWFFNIGFWF